MRVSKPCNPFRPCFVASEWGEAGEDGINPRDASAGAAAAGAATSGAGGGTQPAAAQQRSEWITFILFLHVFVEVMKNPYRVFLSFIGSFGKIS